MSKEMVISANPHETRVAILEEGQLCEYYVEREKEFALVGSIYKGKVTRVLPGMQSAFVEIGLDSDAFLYVSDFLEEIEELDHVVTAVEDKTQKMEAEGGQVFPTNTGSAPIIEPVDVESSPAPALEPLAGESISGSHMPPAPFTAAPPRPSGTTSTGPVEIAVAVLAVAEDAHEAVAAVAGAEATAASVANFLRRNTRRRGHPRITPANRERRKGTFQSCCPGSLWRSSRRGVRRILQL
jgi:Rne/Rng family ribonuclease